jgi:hypothetical protein
MTDADSSNDGSARREFVGVLVCEAITLLALWAFGRFFS